jgi:hypothetical protein
MPPTEITRLSDRGIGAFCVSIKARLVALVEKGSKPVIRIYELSSFRQVCVIHKAAELGVSALAFSRSGKTIAIAGSVPDLTVAVYSVSNGSCIVSSTSDAEITQLEFSACVKNATQSHS